MCVRVCVVMHIDVCGDGKLLVVMWGVMYLQQL